MNICNISYDVSGNEFDVRAKAVINATGPFTDGVRKMDDPSIANICQPSAGVHVILPGYYRSVIKFCFFSCVCFDGIFVLQPQRNGFTGPCYF